MKKIILDENRDCDIKFSDVDERFPVFAKRDGKLSGMIVKENEGWILRIGHCTGANGHHDTLKGCVESCLKYDYEFFVA